jgi:hypothetical protein
MRLTLPCRASLHRKAVRLQKTIAAKTLVPRQLSTDRALADADIHRNFRLLQTPFLKGINLASVVSGQMMVCF